MECISVLKSASSLWLNVSSLYPFPGESHANYLKKKNKNKNNNNKKQQLRWFWLSGVKRFALGSQLEDGRIKVLTLASRLHFWFSPMMRPFPLHSSPVINLSFKLLVQVVLTVDSFLLRCCLWHFMYCMLIYVWFFYPSLHIPFMPSTLRVLGGLGVICYLLYTLHVIHVPSYPSLKEWATLLLRAGQWQLCLSTYLA